METRFFIFETLKTHLKARNVKYRDLARQLQISEQSIKRIFSQQDCSLNRLEEICEIAQINLRDLIKSSPRKEKLINQLTYEQEEFFASNEKLLMVAICTMSLWTYEDLIEHLSLSKSQCQELLLNLDKIGFIHLMEGNRYRLRVAPDFSWIIDGPIMRMVRSMANDFFSHKFEGDAEILKIINVRISRKAALKLKARLESIAQEYADQVAIDARSPLHERPPLSICIAARSWVPLPMRKLLKNEMP